MVLIAVILIITTNKFYLPMFCVYLISPIQNHFGQGDNKNVSIKSTKIFEKDKRFEIPLHFFVVFEICVWIWGLIVMSDDINPKGFWFSVQKPQTYSDYFGFVLITAFFGALNNVVGHELIHHRESYNKIMGFLPNAKSMSAQWVDEHIKGHHKWVSTLEDPATSRKNESIFYFILRSLYGARVNVWGYESNKITKRYGEDCNIIFRILYNKMLWYEISHFVIMYGVYFFFGWESFKFAACQAAMNLYLFETINYIEHYGILRKKDKNGVYESIGKMHSWNYLSGVVIIRIQRHSDHHAHSFRPYQILRRMDDAPAMAFEYLHSYFLASIPPLWFYIMNPRVEALDDIKNGRVNEKKTQWNNIMEANDEDQKRNRVGWFFIFLFQCTMGYLCFA